MNKGDIIESVASKTGYPKTAVTEVLNESIALIAKAAKKETVILLGLGTFKPVKRKARVGVNPSTGKKLKIPAYRTVKFTAAANIKKF
jgi:nucleoid DNA-binding protein